MTFFNANIIASPVTLVTTAETAAIIVTPPPASDVPLVGYSPRKIAVVGYVNVTGGTGTTAVQLRVRGGSGTGGAQLLGGSPDVHTLAAGATASIPFFEEDKGPQFTSATGFTYTVTIQQVGASGNGTVNFGFIGIIPMISGA